MNDTYSISGKALGSVKWAYLSTLLPKLVSPFVTFVLAWYLVPEDYGIVGMSLIVVGLVDRLQSMGLGEAIVQRTDQIEHCADISFWSNIVLGLLLYGMIFFLAPIISEFFHESRLVAVLRVQGCMIIISSFAAVQKSLLFRAFKFKNICLISIVSAIFPLMVAFPLAAYGLGYWALVWSSLVGMAAQAVLLWRYSSWRPTFKYDIVLAHQLLRFGGLVFLTSLLGWVLNSGDRLILGHYLGSANLGLYIFAYTIINLLIGSVVQPLSNVIYPLFCRLQSKESELRRFYAEISKTLAFIVIPMSIGISLIAPLFVSTVLGSRWNGLITILQILGFNGMLWLTPNVEFLRAIGYPGLVLIIRVFQILIAVPAYLISVKFGLLAFCFASVFITLVSLIPELIIPSRILHFSKSFLWDIYRAPVISNIAMGLVVFALMHLTGAYTNGIAQKWAILTGIIFTGVATYAMSSWITDKKFCQRLFQAGHRYVFLRTRVN